MLHKAENLEIFSPKNFTEYIGQNRAKKIANVIVGAARIEQRSLPNILIDGSYGTGKTSLAKVICNEAGLKPRIVDAKSITDGSMFSGGTPVIVDEIHNLDPKVADSLNIDIDRGSIKLIGCTTNPGLLPAPFRSRFRPIHLESYTAFEIQHILTLVSVRKQIMLGGSVLNDIAKRSRLNPRVALNHLAFMFDYMTVSGLMTLTTQQTRKAFDMLGVDAKGFEGRDYQYMAALSDRPVGLAHISAVIGIDAKTIETEIEPYLLQTRHIDRMPRGRIKLKEI